MRRGHLLLISPAFHGYWRSIASSFEGLGWQVSTHCYDAASTLVDKARVKITRELMSRLGRPDIGAVAAHQTQAAIAAIRDCNPDRVLIVKGDTLNDELWDVLDAKHLPRTLWLYDELRRMNYTSDALRRADAIATYSQLDAEAMTRDGHRVAMVPLAYDPSLAGPPRRVNAITFIGARYPKREAHLSALHAADLPVYAFGRDWSSHWWDRARTWRWAASPFSTGRDLGLRDTYAVMAGSPATLNIHSDQDGFTMRTFEACGVGGVQLIDRYDVQDFYDNGTEILCFDSTEELVDLARRCLKDPAWTETIRRRAQQRTLAEHTFDHRARALEQLWG